jgi:hypothetical protein
MSYWVGAQIGADIHGIIISQKYKMVNLSKGLSTFSLMTIYFVGQFLVSHFPADNIPVAHSPKTHFFQSYDPI